MLIATAATTAAMFALGILVVLTCPSARWFGASLMTSALLIFARVAARWWGHNRPRVTVNWGSRRWFVWLFPRAGRAMSESVSLACPESHDLRPRMWSSRRDTARAAAEVGAAYMVLKETPEVSSPPPLMVEPFYRWPLPQVPLVGALVLREIAMRGGVSMEQLHSLQPYTPAQAATILAMELSGEVEMARRAREMDPGLSYTEFTAGVFAAAPVAWQVWGEMGEGPPHHGYAVLPLQSFADAAKLPAALARPVLDAQVRRIEEEEDRELLIEWAESHR